MKIQTTIFFIFFIFFNNLFAQSIWNDVGYGQWTVVHFKNSPFPYGENNEPAFLDNSVYIFIPKGFIQTEKVDLIIDHHGHGSIIDPNNDEQMSYVEVFRQDYQLYESRKNAILIIPQAARNKATGAPGKFQEFNGFKTFIEETINFLKSEKIIFNDAELGDIHINSFSGGYWITSLDITNNSEDFLKHIKSVHLWDSFYSKEKEFFDWIFNKKKMFFNTFTPHGATTGLSNLLRDSLFNSQINFDTCFHYENELPQVVNEFTHKNHGDVANGEFHFKKYLKKLKLKDIDITDPEFIGAFPQNNGIIIKWVKEDNKYLIGHRLYGMNEQDWTLLADENLLTKNKNEFFHNAEGKWKYKLVAISSKGSEKESEIFFEADNSGKADILIVHGENRKIGKTVRGFKPKEFLYEIKKDLVSDISNLIEKPFASCKSDALKSGLINLNDYKYIFWLANNETIKDKILDYTEQTAIEKYLDDGGNLFICGSNIAFDFTSLFSSENDRLFGEKIFGISDLDSIKTEKIKIIVDENFSNELKINDFEIQIYSGFKYAIQPLLKTANGSIISSLTRKSNKEKNNFHTTMTLNIPISEFNNFAKQKKLIEFFFDYCDNGAITPDPPQLPKEIYLLDGKISENIFNNEQKIIVDYFSSDKKIISSDTISSKEEFPEIKDLTYFRLKAMSGKMLGRLSEMIGGGNNNAKRKVLIVNGYDRVTPNNTKDFIIEHAEVFHSLGYDIDFATNEVMENMKIDLSKYFLIDWFVGDESTSDITFSTKEQGVIRDYIDSGGKIIVSGAEIGWDLVEKAKQKSDSLFIKEVFGAKYLGDDANTDKIFLSYENKTELINFCSNYNVPYPDIYSPLDDADLLFAYDNNLGAAIGKKYTNGAAAVFFGFPLEAIKDIENRKRVFEFIINYFNK